MKVAFLLSIGKGGLPHYAAELANAVAKREEVVVLKPSETTADEVFSDDVEVVNAFDPIEISIPDIYKLNLRPVELVRSLASYRNIERVREFDPDVVHDVMGLFPHIKFFASRTRISEDYPFVVTYHELTSPRYPPSHPPMFLSHLVKDLLPNVPIDAGIVHTKRQATILENSSYRPDEIEVIPHGAYDFFTDYEFEATAEEENTVLFFGNVIKEKGIDVLIEALPKVREEIPDVTLIVAGDGRLSDRSRKILDRYPENVEVHNYFVPNETVGEFFSRAQLVAVPYRTRDGSKGHSGVLSTAFSFRKPIIGTTAGEMPELVGDEDCGLIVPPEDPTALADGIVQILSDDERRREMAANSGRMAEKLSWDTIAQRHLELYEGAIGRRKPVDSLQH